MKIDLIVAGKLKASHPLYDLCEEYKTRLKWTLNIIEIDSRYRDSADVNADENRKIMEKVQSQAFTIVMDERGNGLRSLDFAKTLENLQDTGETHLQFIIGGADGLSDDVKDSANMLLSFGQQTWPHMLVRAMVLEQIYRAQQILSGHPYHRE